MKRSKVDEYFVLYCAVYVIKLGTLLITDCIAAVFQPHTIVNTQPFSAYDIGFRFSIGNAAG